MSLGTGIICVDEHVTLEILVIHRFVHPLGEGQGVGDGSCCGGDEDSLGDGASIWWGLRFGWGIGAVSRCTESLVSRSMGLDVGSKTVGIAISDPLGMFAQPVETLARTGRRADVEHIRKLCVQYEPGCIVVGLPIGTDGVEMESAAEARRMAVAILGVLEGSGVQMVLLDERFTTAQAERVLLSGNVRRKKRKQVIDQVAAVLILQQWLDRPFGGELVELDPPRSS